MLENILNKVLYELVCDDTINENFFTLVENFFRPKIIIMAHR